MRQRLVQPVSKRKLHGLFGDAPQDAPEPTDTELLVALLAVLGAIAATIAGIVLFSTLAVAAADSLSPNQPTVGNVQLPMVEAY